jgi:hypothetical protein
MMTRTSLALLALLACQADPSLTADTASLEDLSRADVRGTAAVAAARALQVRAMPDGDRLLARASLATLMETCPYTRHAVLVAFALHEEVQGIPFEHLDPLVQRDWIRLERGLASHVALLEDLGVEAEGLHGDQTALASAQTDLSTLLDRARAVDPATSELIEHHSEQMETLTGIGRPCPRGPWSILPGQPWTLGTQLAGWDDALRRVQPFVQDGGSAARIATLLELLEGHGAANFASVTGSPPVP